jgi:hypothetical protein
MFSVTVSTSDQRGEPVTATSEKIADYLQTYDHDSKVLALTPGVIANIPRENWPRRDDAEEPWPRFSRWPKKSITIRARKSFMKLVPAS